MTQARGAMEPDPEQPRGTRSTLLAINTLTIMSGAAIAPALPMLEAAYDESAASVVC